MNRKDEGKALLSVRMLALDLERLRALADRQERSLSDVVRRVLRQAVRQSQASEAQGDAGR